MAFIYRDGIKYTAIVDIHSENLPEHPDYINEHAVYRRYEDGEPHYWVHDSQNDKWTELSNNPFEGATIDEDGKEGDVPQPLKEDVYRFIKGDGTWADVKAIYYNGIQNSADFFNNPLNFIGGIRQYFKDDDAITTTTWYQGPGVGDLTGTVTGLVTISVVRLHDIVMITEELNVHESAIINGHTQKRFGRYYIPAEKRDDIINIIDDVPSIDWWPWGYFEEVYGGATHTTDGRIGLVPKPNKKHEAKFLSAEGGWKDVKAFTHNGEFDPTTYLNDPRNMIVSIKQMFDVDDNITLAANILGTYNFGDGAKEIYGVSEITILRNSDSNLVAYEHVKGVDPTYATPYEYSRIGNYTIPESARSDSLNIYSVIIDWRPWNDINNNFIGSKLNEDGAAGRVPKPLAENFDDVLTGSGIWRNAFIGDVVRDANAHYDLDASPYLVQYVQTVYDRTRYQGYRLGAYSTETVSFPAKVKIPPSTSYVTGVCEMEISFNFAQSADWSTLILKQKFTVVENESYGHVKEPIVYERTGTHGRPNYTYAAITDPASYTWTTWTPSFTGATETENGSYGHVPKPLAREEDHFLRGNGNWETVKGTITGTTVRGPSVFDNPVSEIVKVKRYFDKGDSCALEVPVNGSYSIDGDTWVTGVLHIMAIRMDNDSLYVYETIEEANTSDQNASKYIRFCELTLPDDPATIDLSTYETGATWTRYDWQKINYPKVFKGATIGNNGKAGLVPAPNAADFNDILCADGKWDYPHIGSKTGDYISLDGDGPYNKYVGPVVDEIKDDDDIKYLTKIVSFPAHEFNYSNKFGQCVMEIVLNKDRKSIVLNETLTVNHSSDNGEVYYRVETLDDWDSLNYKQGGSYTSGTWIKLYSAFEGATTEHDGTMGLVPKPVIGDQDKFLKGDGTWADATADKIKCETSNSSITDISFYDLDYVIKPTFAVAAEETKDSAFYMLRTTMTKKNSMHYVLPACSTSIPGIGDKTLANGRKRVYGNATITIHFTTGSPAHTFIDVEFRHAVSASDSNTEVWKIWGHTSYNPVTTDSNITWQKWRKVDQGSTSNYLDVNNTNNYYLVDQFAGAGQMDVYTQAKTNSTLTYAVDEVYPVRCSGSLYGPLHQTTYKWVSGTGYTFIYQRFRNFKSGKYLIDDEWVRTGYAAVIPVTSFDQITWTPWFKQGAFSGATASAAGSMGYVPVPAAGAQNNFLKGNGTWSALPSLTTSQAGIVSKAPNNINKCLLGNATWGAPENAKIQKIETTNSGTTGFYTLDKIKETASSNPSAFFPIKEATSVITSMEYTLPAITSTIPDYSAATPTYPTMYGQATIKIYRDRSSSNTKNACIEVTFRREQLSYHNPHLEWKRIGYMQGKDYAVEDTDVTWSEWQQTYSNINKFLATFTCNSTYFQSAAVQEVAKISPNAYIVHITCSAKTALSANTEYIIASAGGLKICGKNPTLATTSGMYGTSGTIHGVCCFGNNGAIYGRFTSAVASGTGIRIIATVVLA